MKQNCRASILTLVLLWVSIVSYSQDENYLHTVYVSLPTQYPYTIVSYEANVLNVKKFTFKPRVGIGTSVLRPSRGKDFNLNTSLVALFGNSKHKLEFGMGLIHNFYSNYNYDLREDELKYKPYIYYQLGYRLILNDKLMFKFCYYPITGMSFNKFTSFRYLDLGIGYNFGVSKITKRNNQ